MEDVLEDFFLQPRKVNKSFQEKKNSLSIVFTFDEIFKISFDYSSFQLILTTPNGSRAEHNSCIPFETISTYTQIHFQMISTDETPFEAYLAIVNSSMIRCSGWKESSVTKNLSNKNPFQLNSDSSTLVVSHFTEPLQALTDPPWITYPSSITNFKVFYIKTIRDFLFRIL